MKKKIFLIITVIILIIFIVVISSTNNKNLKVDFNTDLKISTSDTFLNATIQSLSNDKYNLNDVDVKLLTNDEEKKILELAYNITNAINDIDNDNYVYNVEKYAVRMPSIKIGDYIFENSEYKVWNEKILELEAFANMIRSKNGTFEKISDAKITYSSNKRTIVQVYVDNYTVTYGTKEYGLDAIFEYEIVYEEISNLYKVNKFAVEWIRDLNDYYEKNDKEERRQSNDDSSSILNVSLYMPKGYSNLNYSKIEEVTSDTTNNIYNKNKDSIIIIDSVSDSGISTGSASGFYIRKGIIVTSYNSIYSMIEKGATRYYAVDEKNKITEIEGIVAAYSDLNIVILKTKEEKGKSIEIGDSSTLKKNDPIVVISSSLGLKASIKLGIYFDEFNDDYKVIRTSLPLIDGDSGSAVFNLKGQVIAINTSVSNGENNYNSGLNNATDISMLKDIINKINQQNFNEIKIIKFSKLNSDNKYQSINDVDNDTWNKYKKIPDVSNVVPLSLYSAYTSNNYLTVRYKPNNYTTITNDEIIKLYIKELENNSYIKISNNMYKKDDITIRIKNNLGYLILIIEGVV